MINECIQCIRPTHISNAHDECTYDQRTYNECIYDAYMRRACECVRRTHSANALYELSQRMRTVQIRIHQSSTKRNSFAITTIRRLRIANAYRRSCISHERSHATNQRESYDRSNEYQRLLTGKRTASLRVTTVAFPFVSGTTKTNERRQQKGGHPRQRERKRSHIDRHHECLTGAPSGVHLNESFSSQNPS